MTANEDKRTMKSIRPLKVTLATLTGVLLISGAVRAGEDEDDSIPLDKVPPAALAALQARAGTPITKVDQNDEDGVISYQAEFTVKGKKQEVTVDAQGKVIGEEIEVTEQEVPPAALTAIKASAPGATLSKVVKETDHDKVTYEAELKLNGKTSKVTVTAAGGPVAEEMDEEGKKGEGKDKEEKKKDGKKKEGKDEEDDDKD